jgi:late competence protein required for DNA uptake (superfamily II DNA/RNA helicase)
MAAIDETADGEYFAMVIGDKKSILSNAERLPRNFIHISSIFYSKRKKKNIVKNLNLSGNILVYCVKFGIPNLKTTIEKSRNRIPKNKIERKLAYWIVSKINKTYSNFLFCNGIHIQDIRFEVDTDMLKGYLQASGLQSISPSDAHKIADCVAYANIKGWPVKGNLKEDGDKFEKTFYQQVMDSFK